MKSYDIYLFDLDGTLTNTGLVWLGIFRDSLADFNITGLDDKIIANHTHDWKEVTKLGVPEADLQQFVESAYARANERLPLAPLYKGAKAMVKGLREKGKTLGIFTGMDRPIVEPIIKLHELDELFDVIVAGTDVEHRKPSPDGIHLALGKLNGKPGQTVYIGDKDTDILCGQNAGTDTILFYPPDHTLLYDHDALLASNPTHIIKSWEELIP